MPRNPKSPVEYTSQPRQRAKEKLEIVLEMLVLFHYSTRGLLLQRLGLATHSHHNYFKMLEDRGLIRKVETYSSRSKFVYLLTPIGKELAAEKLVDKLLDKVIHYITDVARINHSNLRHDLAVQKAVIERLHDFDSFTPEKFLTNLPVVDKKKPDACLEKNGIKTMLEVELTPKNDRRIFRAFSSHAEALLKHFYHKVVYIFPSQTLANYYKTRFDQAMWPCFEQNERGRWERQDKSIYPDEHPTLRACFEFIAEPTLLDTL